ncbi:MAG: deoxyribonuclease IV [Clostridia bacterium]|nr:deoxyribonuclease IV [Clostridia bacterium]NCC75816.1 deoxyribonuclease IV [Clostridia bacterium]
MLKIGCHLSIAKGYTHMGEEALSIDANTFQFFTRNPRGSQMRTIDLEDIKGLKAILEQHQFAPLLGHAPYTMNPCAADAGLYELAATMMAEDLQRLEPLPGQFYNFHPGSHVGQGIEVGIEKIAALLNRVLTRDGQTLVLLETMAGKGSEVGSRFEEIRAIIDRIQEKDRLGVCLDTCHVYSAGYDIVNDLDGVLEQFDRNIGLDRLKAIHLNDSLTPFNSHKDRHACIGEGSLGLDAIVRFINHPRLRELPFYLETPNEIPGYAAEIKLLREHYS